MSALWMSDGAGRTLNVLWFESEETARGAMARIRDAPRPGYLALDSTELFRVLATA